MTKKEIRIKYKALRMALSADGAEESSLLIANKLISMPIWEFDFYHIFLPIVAKQEIDTAFILHILQGKDKNILLSKSDFDTREMTHFLLTDSTKIIENEYGIPEPVGGIEMLPEKIDVIFVPLLAFDDSGNRIGYGKGFYDKFLARCKPEAIKIGLSFFESVENWEDVFESDVKLDFCVTPTKVYWF